MASTVGVPDRRDPGTPPRIRTISHLSLSVRDLERSLAFYRDVLRLQVLREPYDGVVFQGRQAMLLAGRVVVSLQQHADAGTDEFSPTRAGLDHLAFDVEDRAELEQWYEDLLAAGLRPSEVKRVDPFGWMLEVRDPDGIQLELFTTT